MPYDPRALIVTAFNVAKTRGKDDWRRMTSAVLKNRLLQLSRGEFREENHGVASFRAFIGLFPDLLQTEPGGTLALREDAPMDAGHPSKEQVIGANEGRVRQDLWWAVMDYSSGKHYYWEHGAASAGLPGTSGEPRLPTVTEQELDTWRAEFVSRNAQAANSSDRERLERWAKERLATAALPRALQHAWNADMKHRVVERLRGWFSERHVPAPEDLLQPAKARVGEASGSDDELRTLVLRCVATMTREELEALRLPPAAIVRAMKGRPAK